MPELIFCYGGNKHFAEIAVSAGYLYGVRLPDYTPYATVSFADQNWHKPDRAAYIAVLAKHRPRFATVLDWERAEQLREVLGWAEEAARYCERVIIIPKVLSWNNPIARLPRRIGGRDILLGYSVPTRHGGTDAPLYQFGGWPIHLLGGSPQAQMRLARRLGAIAEVVSADGNMSALEANSCRFWSAEKGPKGHWWQLSEAGDTDRERGARERAFRRSCHNIMAAWRAIESA